MNAPRADGQSGATLVELLVVTVLLGVVMAVTTTALIRVGRASAVVGQRNDDLSQVRVAMDELTRTLRVAVAPPGSTSPFSEASTSAVTFTANLRSAVTSPPPAAGTPGNEVGPRRIRLVVAGTELREQIWYAERNAAYPATSAAPYLWTGAPDSQRTLARDLADTDVFAFYGAGDAVLATSGALPAASWPAVRSVSIEVAVHGDAQGDSEPTAVRNRVELVNPGL